MSEDQKKATVGKAHATSRIAELIFLASLPAPWLPRKQEPDFHIDYKVETTVDGELTGINFGVQLKGWTPKKGSNKAPGYALLSKHLRYYVEKCTIPIFLVIVDVTSKRCYWKFIQQHAKEDLAASKTKTRKSVTIRFAEGDTLDLEQLAVVVKAAQGFMRELHPGSVPAAIFHQKALLEEKYPQFTLTLDCIADALHIHAHPKQDLSLKLKLPAAAHSVAFQEFFEKGKDFAFASTALQFTGTPLVDDLVHGKPGLIRLLRKPVADGQAVISWIDESATPWFVAIPGSFKKGDKYITFQGALLRSPLSLEIWFTPESLNEGKTPAGGFAFDPRAWHGKHVESLPHFESIRALFVRMRSGLPLNFELTAEGNSLGQSSFKEPDSDRLRPYCAWINLLNRARAIVRCFPISAAVPIVVSPQQFIWIEELYDLVTNGRHEYQAVGGEFTFVTDQPTSLEDFVGRTITMDIKVVKTYSVFETPICIGPLQEATINVKVVSIVRNLKNEVEIACSLSTDSHVTLVSLENPIKQQPLS